MIWFASTNDPSGIAVSPVPRQLWPALEGIRGLGLRAGRDTVKKTAVKRTTLGCELALGVVIAIGVLFSRKASGQTATQVRATEQCSLAVVSRLVASDRPVCEDGIVRQMAGRGHAFEQNQLGIASILAIGPDYDEREALKWFGQAAQRGYAPAQVNLAVMLANGWGTPVNYGRALEWLHAAADQHFARAYYNLGILYMEGKGVRQDNG